MVELDIGKPTKFIADKESIYAYFPYDEKVLAVMREQPRAYYHKESKEWEIPYIHLGTLIDGLKQRNIDYQFSNDAERVVTQKPRLPKEFKYKTIPYRYQRLGVKRGYETDRFILGDDQGLGKTKQVIDLAVAKKHSHGYKHVLIICGVGGNKWNWLKEVEIHSNETATVLGSRIKRNGRFADDETKRRVKALEDGIKEYFIITNIETLRNVEVVEILHDMCKNGDIGLIAVDEVHKVRNANSQQGKGLLALQADSMIAMSGTTIMKNPIDGYVALKWLGYEQRSFYKFKEYYVNEGFNGIIGYKHMEEYQRLLQSVMLRRLKTDELDLPPKLPPITEFVEMGAKQWKLYNAVLNQLQSEIDKIILSPFPIAKLSRLRQVTGSPSVLTDEPVTSAKEERLVELVDEIVEGDDEKIIVFSNFKQTLGPLLLNEKLAKHKPLVITGETPQAERIDIIDKFQSDPKHKVIMGTIGALGTGWTLTAASVVIFMDEPWDDATKVQAEDRAYRIGTTKPLKRITIVAQGTYDEDISEMVEMKGTMAEILLDQTTEKYPHMRTMVYSLLGLKEK